MSADLKKGAAPFGSVFLGGLVIALLARIGVFALDAVGAFSYSYRAATAPYIQTGSTLDQLCMALSGGTLIGFMVASGLAMALAVATVLVFAYVYRGESGRRLAGPALVWGVACVAVSLVCLGVIVAGLFSGVQLHQITSKGGAETKIVLLMVLLCASTLVAAACVGLGSALRGAAKGWFRRVMARFAACGALVCVFTAGSFGAINAESVSLPWVIGWTLCAIALNVGMIALFSRETDRGASR